MNFLNRTNTLISQSNHCRAVADSCEFFNYIFNISQAELFVCDTRVTYSSQGGSRAPGGFSNDIKNGNICNLMTHVKRHFENKVNLKNDSYWQKM